MPRVEKIVLVTKKTALEELIERFNTRDQARFYIEHMGGTFAEYDSAHNDYLRALAEVRHAVPSGCRLTEIERGFLPNYTFGDDDLVVTLGPDGLVVNTSKYLGPQSLLAINPDPQRMDGVLIPFTYHMSSFAIGSAVNGRLNVRPITMAIASLNDGQKLYAVNDLFIGQKSHVSARYQLKLGELSEQQSSSGIIVSTGAGSTGWYRSVLTGSAGIIHAHLGDDAAEAAKTNYAFPPESTYLQFTVREPFISRASAAELVYGRIEAGQNLEIVSQMPQNGVIFSDGIEADYLEFNSGSIANIGVADRRLKLLVNT